jgi:hypothetical protein
MSAAAERKPAACVWASAPKRATSANGRTPDHRLVKRPKALSFATRTGSARQGVTLVANPVANRGPKGYFRRSSDTQYQ